MASTEAGPKIVDLVTAELVECQPDEADVRAVAIVTALSEASPVQQAAKATIEQVGADPPPAGDL